MIRYQVGALQAFLDAADVPLNHVKPHGVLYGMMYRDPEVCRAVYRGVPKGTRVFGLAGTCHETIAEEVGLVFGDGLWCFFRRMGVFTHAACYVRVVD